MLGPVLDTAIAVVMVFVVLSLFATGIHEWVAGLLETRSKNLRTQLDEMLSSPVAGALLEHGLIKDLSRGERSPSFIPPERFVAAFMDLHIKTKQTAEEIESAINTIQEPKLQEAVRALWGKANGEREALEAGLKDWFDDSMDMASAWYRRETQKKLMIISMVVVVILNADILRISETVWTNSALRDALVTQAEGLSNAVSAEAAAKSSLDIKQEQVDNLLNSLPMGWRHAPSFEQLSENWIDIVYMVLGWILTAIGMSFGAPFWFETLGKLLNLKRQFTGGGSANAASSGKQNGNSG